MKKYVYGFIITTIVMLFSFLLFSCNKTLNVPNNINFSEDEVLSWDRVNGAKTYEVLLNNESFYVDDNKIDLFDKITEVCEYEIRVRALSDDINKDSNFSSIIKYQIPLCTNFIVRTYNNEVIIVKPKDNIKGKIRIPEEVNGMKITQIENECFKGYDDLTGVIMDGIEMIGHYSFSNCNNLRLVSCKKITHIQPHSFYNCKKLSNIILTDSLDHLSNEAFYNTAIKSIYISKNVSSIFASTFYGCNDLLDVEISKENKNYYIKNNCIFSYKNNELIRGFLNSTIPEDTKIISNNAFSGIDIENIYLPNGIEEIGVLCFLDCKKLKEIRIPLGLKNINPNIITGCVGLEKITIDKNDKYEVINECLIDKAEGCVILGCKNSIIPTDNNITKIYGNTFKNVGLKRIEIPSNIKTIGNAAFSSSDDLEEVILNEGLESIGEEAFGYCFKIKSVILPKSVKTCEGFIYCACQVMVHGETIISFESHYNILHHYLEIDYDETVDLTYDKYIYGCNFNFDIDWYIYSISSNQKYYRSFIVPYRKGYRFIGWSTSTSMEDIVTSINKVTPTRYDMGGEHGKILYEEEIDVVVFDENIDFTKYDRFYAIWEKHTGNMSIYENK